MNSFSRAAIVSLSVLAGMGSSDAFARSGLVNGSFELPAAAPDGFVNGSITGWSGPTGQSFWFGVTSQLGLLPPLVEGNQAAFVNNFSGGGGIPTSNAICQQLTDVFEPNIAYTFSASFGWRNDNAASIGTIEIWAGGSVSQGSVAGGTLLASKNVTLTKGQFVPASVTYLSLPSSPHLGKAISVRLVGKPVANAFAQTNFDAAHLYRSTIVTCPGDINGDHVTDDTDFSLFVTAYNALVCPDAPANCAGDFNHDGQVDDADFGIFVVNYNDLLCPETKMQFVSQTRFVTAQGCPNSQASATSFDPFNLSVNGSCSQQGSSSASQNSTLDPLHITLNASIGGQLGSFGGLSGESMFTVVFDVLDLPMDFSLNYSGHNDSNKGAPTLTGPGTNLQLTPTLGIPLKGTLQPGRYTLFVDVYGPGFIGGSATLDFSGSTSP